MMANDRLAVLPDGCCCPRRLLFYHRVAGKLVMLPLTCAEGGVNKQQTQGVCRSNGMDRMFFEFWHGGR